MTKESGYSVNRQTSSPPNHSETALADSLLVPTEHLSQLLADMLAAGRTVRLPVWGGSMLPSLCGGDVVEVKPATAADLRSGDIVVCRLPEAHLVVHRVIATARWQGQWWLVLWPETGHCLNAPSRDTHLLGKVVAVERAGRPVDFSRPVPFTLRCRAHASLLHTTHPRLWRWLRTLLRPTWQALIAILRALPKLAEQPHIGWLVHRRPSNWQKQMHIERIPVGPPPHDRDWQWGALYRGRLIGTIGLSSTFGNEIGFPSYWLVGFWVDPWYRRSRIAPRLHRALMKFAVHHRITDVWAAVRRDSTAFSASRFTSVNDPDLQEKVDRWYEQTASRPPGTMLILRLPTGHAGAVTGSRGSPPAAC